MLNRLKERVRFLLNHGKELNRRVEIENILYEFSEGNRLLTREDCRILALRLGTPKEHWSNLIKNYEFS